MPVSLSDSFALNVDAAPDLANLHWVWSKENKSPLMEAPPGKRYFRKTFDFPENALIKKAVILLAVDNICDVYLNGSRCGSADDWGKVSTIGLKRYLRSGYNVLAIEAINMGTEPSAAGLAGKAVITFDGNVPPMVIPIDETWKASKEKAHGWQNADFNDTAWGNVEAIAIMGSLPWGMVGSSGNVIPVFFPRFEVPDFDKPMERLRQMFFLHYSVGVGGTLWDGWMPMATLWPATSSSSEFNMMRRNWQNILSARRIDAEGYVSCHQHKGLAHSEGWPFPLWMQAGGVGWQFSLDGLPYGTEFRVVQTTNIGNWTLQGAKNVDFDRNGWNLLLEKPDAMITTPIFEVDAFVAPFIRLEWQASEMGSFCKPYMEWTTKDDPNFSSSRRIYFSPITELDNSAYTMIAVYKMPVWKGKITRLRFNFNNTASSKVTIKMLMTTVDSRHSINNATYLQGCNDYVNLTGDITFLRENIQKMRLAMRYAISEFGIDKNKCVVTPWIGHDGHSGLERYPNGRKIIHVGRGIGNNYWDLLPFGGRDALATIYYYDVIKRMAALEKSILQHPQWNIPTSPLRFDPNDLNRLAAEIKEYAGKLFWNSATGRFVSAIDIDGKSYDYGFTMVNCEAIYYDFASKEQAVSIVDWISGKRTVEGDTSQGGDIYHWRFAPRATTKRNIEYYAWVWSAPEEIPWGDQVQDGGAVLGFSYHDIMARLKINGPDNAWQRLGTILEWFKDVQDVGGYRTYYSVPGRGILQGGGPPGGLGLDKEFSESVLVPQVMLYGFMGFKPCLDGFAINPQLPQDWQQLAITRIQLHDVIMDITAKRQKICIKVIHGQLEPLSVLMPKGEWSVSYSDADDKKKPRMVANVKAVNEGIQLQLQTDMIIELEKKDE
jgi:hypothetical protein